MAGTLEDKILDGDNAGYCSSSDEENDNILAKIIKDGDEVPIEARTAMNKVRNTGPKGVLEDWRTCKEIQKNAEEIRRLQILSEAKRFSLLGDVETDNEILEIRQKRLQELKESARGKGMVTELKSKEDFLSCVEKTRNTLVILHIYENAVESCDTMNYMLSALAMRFQHISFAKVQASLLQMSSNFSTNALPTLQVYYNESLIGNFVRILDTLGEDFDVRMLTDFFYKSECEIQWNLFSEGCQQWSRLAFI